MAQAKRILLIQGHPDLAASHLGHALAQAYEAGALEGGHAVQVVRVAELDFPFLRGGKDPNQGSVPETLVPAQAAVAWAEHLVLFFPLWLGGAPALLKGFWEQLAPPGFAPLQLQDRPGPPTPPLSGRSARMVVTMNAPASVYKGFFKAHSAKELERNLLGALGAASVRETLVGSVDSLSSAQLERWLLSVRMLGGLAS